MYAKSIFVETLPLVIKEIKLMSLNKRVRVEQIAEALERTPEYVMELMKSSQINEEK